MQLNWKLNRGAKSLCNRYLLNRVSMTNLMMIVMPKLMPMLRIRIRLDQALE